MFKLLIASREQLGTSGQKGTKRQSWDFTPGSLLSRVPTLPQDFSALGEGGEHSWVTGLEVYSMTIQVLWSSSLAANHLLPDSSVFLRVHCGQHSFHPEAVWIPRGPWMTALNWINQVSQQTIEFSQITCFPGLFIWLGWLVVWTEWVGIWVFWGSVDTAFDRSDATTVMLRDISPVFCYKNQRQVWLCGKGMCFFPNRI